MNNFKKLVLGSSLAALSIPTSVVVAQDDLSLVIEEVIVTGRKREESLTDVPVSISVYNQSAIEDLGILNQRDLFDNTVGLHFDTVFGDRNSSAPAVRGVQSNSAVATNQKVNTFIDGTPVLGNVGSLTFSGVDQVEVYRGPQSAAFGRSTFAGAIHYVTADASEEFEASVSTRLSDLGDNELGLVLSGPINDKLGYRVSYVADEFEGPDEWRAADGTQLGATETGTLTAKLNFEFSDTVYGEVSYTNLDQEDSPTAEWTLNPEECFGTSGNFSVGRAANLELFDGPFDCDVSNDSSTRVHDVLGQFNAQYDANRAFYEASVGNIAALDANGDGQLSSAEYLSQSLSSGETFEQALLGQSVDPFIFTERDRFHGNLNFEIGDSTLTFLGMVSEETSQRWQGGTDGTVAFFDVPVAMAMATTPVDTSPVLGVGTGSMSDPTQIDETYIEARWVSPEDQRLRYTVSASYYEYDLTTDVFFNYGAIVNDLRLPDGSPVDPDLNSSTANGTENVGVAFGLNYDISDKMTVSFEGRYQNDENCVVDDLSGLENCVSTTSFAPRLALNYSISDDSSAYVQLSQGTNPAGLNVLFSETTAFAESLRIASGQLAVPDTDSDGNPLPNAGIVYDGSNGVNFAAAGFDASDFLSFDEEVLTNFEIGYKGTFLNGRGRFSAALYYMDWEDLLVSGSIDWDDQTENGWNVGGWNDNTNSRATFNSGTAELFGLELDGSFLLNEIVTIGGNVSISENTYSDYCSVRGPDFENAAGESLFPVLEPGIDDVSVVCSDATGFDLPRGSEVKGALNITADLPNDIFGLQTSVRADIKYTSEYFGDDFNLSEFDSVTTLNVSANMRSENITLRLFMNNVTDNDEPLSVANVGFLTQNENPTIAPAQTAAFAIVPRRPREVGVSFKYDF